MLYVCMYICSLRRHRNKDQLNNNEIFSFVVLLYHFPELLRKPVIPNQIGTIHKNGLYFDLR